MDAIHSFSGRLQARRGYWQVEPSMEAVYERQSLCSDSQILSISRPSTCSVEGHLGSIDPSLLLSSPAYDRFSFLFLIRLCISVL